MSEKTTNLDLVYCNYDSKNMAIFHFCTSVIEYDRWKHVTNSV